jgi:hypothetical protein
MWMRAGYNRHYLMGLGCVGAATHASVSEAMQGVLVTAARGITRAVAATDVWTLQAVVSPALQLWRAEDARLLDSAAECLFKPLMELCSLDRVVTWLHINHGGVTRVPAPCMRPRVGLSDLVDSMVRCDPEDPLAAWRKLRGVAWGTLGAAAVAAASWQQAEGREVARGVWPCRSSRVCVGAVLHVSPTLCCGIQAAAWCALPWMHVGSRCRLCWWSLPQGGHDRLGMSARIRIWMWKRRWAQVWCETGCSWYVTCVGVLLTEGGGGDHGLMRSRAAGRHVKCTAQWLCVEGMASSA